MHDRSAPKTAPYCGASFAVVPSDWSGGWVALMNRFETRVAVLADSSMEMCWIMMRYRWLLMCVMMASGLYMENKPPRVIHLPDLRPRRAVYDDTISCPSSKRGGCCWCCWMFKEFGATVWPPPPPLHNYSLQHSRDRYTPYTDIPRMIWHETKRKSPQTRTNIERVRSTFHTRYALFEVLGCFSCTVRL